jgi:hypothetical protein
MVWGFLLAPFAWSTGFGTAGVGVGAIAAGVQSALFGGAVTARGAFAAMQSASAKESVSSVIAGPAVDAELFGALGSKVSAGPAITDPASPSSGRRPGFVPNHGSKHITSFS